MATLPDRLGRWSREPLAPGSKAVCDRLIGVPRGDFASRGAFLRDCATPVAVLDRDAVEQNISTLQAWADERGWLLAPHGKTTMAPQLWGRQLAAGCWGITVASEAQLRVALRCGVPRIQLANTLLRPDAVDRAVRHSAGGSRVISWVDSPQAVRRMDSSGGGPWEVLVEVGEPGGRCGVRTLDALEELLRSIEAADSVVLRGTAGYEGAVEGAAGDDRRVAEYLERLISWHNDFVGPRTSSTSVLSVGGSAHLSLVEEVLSRLDPDRTEVLLRPGMYVVHDHGHYEQLQRLAPRGLPHFEGALFVVAAVVSAQPNEAMILDAGRRDLGTDHGMPVVLAVWSEGFGPALLATPISLQALNDQHAFVAPDVLEHQLRVGDRVLLGVSHTCTTLDRWREVFEVSGPPKPDSLVIGAMRTFFG